jgi:hypothetical protein
MTVEEIEKVVIERMLQRTGGNPQVRPTSSASTAPPLQQIRKYKIDIHALRSHE